MRKSLAVSLAAAVLAIAASAADTTLPFRLNDTGATLCVVGQPGDRSFSADCAGSGQDGEFGRDSTAPGDADGRAGFSFAKVCHSGDVAGTGVCPADPVPGSAADAWGCTLDRATGLLWEVKTDDGGLHDSRPLYTNFLPGDTRYGNANDAAGFVDAVNASALCGATDWRVPDRVELHSLVDYGVASESRAPTIDAAWFPHTPPDAHWTSSPFRGGTTSGIYINFRKGDTYGLSRASNYALRLVRSKPRPAPRFAVSADGDQVIDRRQRLAWRRCLQGQDWDGSTCVGTVSRSNWTQALKTPARLGRGWRLPNVKELASLVDDTRPDGTIDPLIFPGTPAITLWSGTPLAASPAAPRSAWTVGFLAGIVEQSLYGTLFPVRLVRDQP